MEKDTVAAENGRCSDSPSKIGSISIDLNNVNEKISAEKCDHFSIRKYVSDACKKDWKMCWPFASDDDSNICDEHECELPPLKVRKFRYWLCDNCISEIKAGDVETDQGPTLRTRNNELTSNIICSHAPDLQNPQELNLHKGKKIDVNASVNTNITSGYHPSSYNDEREKNNEVTDFLTPAYNLVSVDNSNKEVHQLRGLIQETYRVDDKVNLKSKSNESLDICKTAFGHHEVANTELVGDLNRVLKKAAINTEEIVITAADMQEELVACDVSREHCNNTNETDKTNGLQSPEVVECDNVSSDSAEVMPGKNLCRGSSSGLHRRKTRKVRLLADLLSENGNRDKDKIKVDDSQLKGISEASEAGGYKPLDLQGNSRRVSGQNRKRKSDEDEEWRPLEMESPNKVCKEVRSSKRDLESAETIAKAFSRMQLQSGVKNHSTKLQNDGNPVLGKKKCKKVILFNDLVSVQDDVLMEAGAKTRDASKSNDVDKVEADKGKDAEFLAMSSQRTDRIPAFMKKKKIIHVDDQQDSSNPWKDAGFSNVQPVRSQFHSARDATSGMGQNLSLGRYSTVPRYDMNRSPLVEDIDTSLLSWQKRTAMEDKVSKKAAETNCVRNLNFGSKSSSDMSFCQGITNGVPLLGENRNYTSQVEIGSCSHMQQKNFCSANNKNKAIVIQEQPTVLRKENNQRANKALEQGNVDDIPMEIVELMAKNQYERCLPDAEHDRHQTINFNKAYGNKELSLFQQGTSQNRNPRAIIDNRNGIINRGENSAPMNLNQLTMSQLHQSPVPVGYQSLFQHQDKSSGRVHHSSSSSGRQNSNQWVGDFSGEKSSQNSFQTSGSCNSCMNIQQNRNTNHIWSSLMPNHMPFLYTGPHKCNSTMNGDSELKFPNQIGKQNRNCSPEILRPYPEHPFASKRNGIELNKKPMGSLDLYSNETIPAMHLLSLMDAGLRSSAPINLDLNSKFLKRTSTANDQNPLEFSRPDSGSFRIPNPTKHTSYDPRGKNQHTEDFARSIGPSSSLFQNDKRFKAIDFTSQEKDKGKGPDTGSRSQQKSKSPSGSTYCGSDPVHSMHTMFFGGSDSVKFPLQNSGTGKSTKDKLEAPNGTRPGRPPKSRSETMICSVNRNPADFSAPEARNSYMISGKDLKFSRRAPAPLAQEYNSARLIAQKRHKKLP